MNTLVLLLALAVPDAGAPARKPVAEYSPAESDQSRRLRALPDLRRFPDLDCCEAVLGFLSGLEGTLRAKRDLAGRCNDAWECARLDAWQDDVCRVRRPWERLHFILKPAYSPEMERAALADLRKLLGEDAYWRGAMPCLCPDFFAHVP